jgi:hypothetical protein
MHPTSSATRSALLLLFDSPSMLHLLSWTHFPSSLVTMSTYSLRSASFRSSMRFRSMRYYYS